MTLVERLAQRAAQVERALDGWLPPATQESRRLHEAMRYSVFAGGKRLRPALVLEACLAVGGDEARALPAAAAAELIHTYSLVHDDLPCMDDDDLRRGKPTNHKVYGEALALLCGDALLTQAFVLLTSEQLAAGVPAAAAVETTAVLANAAGCGGMVGGQAVDIDSAGETARGETLEFIHRHKTAALMRACTEAGAILGGASPAVRRQLATYGGELGLTFQIIDDILDLESTAEKLGKRPGQDQRHGKATYPELYGLGESRRRAGEHAECAKSALRCVGNNAAFLAQLADYLLDRQA